eukprot:11232243-Alexandrium_andersonii.AAC.1
MLVQAACFGPWKRTGRAAVADPACGCGWTRANEPVGDPNNHLPMGGLPWATTVSQGNARCCRNTARVAVPERARPWFGRPLGGSSCDGPPKTVGPLSPTRRVNHNGAVGTPRGPEQH